MPKFNWKPIAKLAFAVVKVAVPAVQTVEDAVKSVKQAHGDEKKKAALDLVKAGILAAEDITNKDIVNDAEFNAVLADLNDVLVRLHNVAAKKAVVPTAVGSPGD